MNAYDKLNVKEMKVFSETLQDLFHLKLLWSKRKHDKLCKCLDVSRSNETFAHNNMRTFSNISLREFISSRQRQQTRQLQKTYKCYLRNAIKQTVFVWQRKQRTNNKRIHQTKTNTNDMTHIDSSALITSLSVSKIGDFGQVQPLWWK